MFSVRGLGGVFMAQVDRRRTYLDFPCKECGAGINSQCVRRMADGTLVVLEYLHTERRSLSVLAWGEPSVLSSPISKLAIPLHIVKALVAYGVHTLEQLTALTPREFLSIQNLGPRSLCTVRGVLEGAGLSLKEPRSRVSP